MGEKRRFCISGILSILIFASGAAILAGWVSGVHWLESFSVGFPAMKPNTAFCFMLLGVALWFVCEGGKRRAVFIRVCSGVAVAIALLTLFEYFFSRDIGIDRVLVSGLGSGLAAVDPGRMAFNSALCFALLGIAVFLLSNTVLTSGFLIQGLAFVSFTIALLSFVGFVYLAKPLYGGHFNTAMAWSSSIIFIITSFAVLFARPDRGFVKNVASPDLGGRMSRWLLPVSMTIPFLLGWFKLYSQRSGLLSNEFGVSFVATANIVVNCGYIYLLSVLLNRVDRRRKEVEKGLIVQTEKLDLAQRQQNAILDNIPDIAWLKDRAGVFIRVNGPFGKACKKPRESITGKTDYDFFPKDLADRYRADDTDVIRSGERKIVEEEFQPAEGKRQVIETIKTPIRDESGEIVGTAGIARDITVRREMERSDRLAQLGRLVADIAHEVNNPLMIISGNAQLVLMDNKIDADTRGALTTITEESQRAKRIIQRLLEFSRPSKGERKTVDVSTVIDMALELVEHHFNLVNVTVKKVYAGDLPPVALDVQQMQEVFLNLLTNAREAMEGGGTIELRTSFADGMIRVDVADTGIGMTDEIRARIFEPFFTTKDKGTGLGLSICSRIVRAHNGQLKVVSSSGKGTTFSLFLPVT